MFIHVPAKQQQKETNKRKQKINQQKVLNIGGLKPETDDKLSTDQKAGCMHLISIFLHKTSCF